jgi:hypothetical protein
VLDRVVISFPELLAYKGNIIIRKSLIIPSAVGRQGIVFGFNPDVGAGASQQGPVTLEDCDIDASLLSTPYKLAALRGAINAYRCNIFGMGTGIAYFGSPSITSAVIENNFVHGLRSGMVGGEQSHGEASTVRDFAGTSLIWRNNRLQSDMQANSAAMFIQANGPDQSRPASGAT